MKPTHFIWKGMAKVFFPHYHNKACINFTLMKFILWQRVLRINSKASWPVHFTSKVISPAKVQNDNGMRSPGYAVGCYIDARNGIIIEENTLVGPHVSLISKNHNKLNYAAYESALPIILRKNSWLANGCTVLAGVELGEHTIVAAGAVVTKSFPEGNQLLAGNPAKVIKQLDVYLG